MQNPNSQSQPTLFQESLRITNKSNQSTGQNQFTQSYPSKQESLNNITKYISYFSQVEIEADRIIKQTLDSTQSYHQHKLIIKDQFLKKRRQYNGVIKPLIQIKDILNYGLIVNYYVYIERFRFQISLLHIKKNSLKLRIIGEGGYGQISSIILQDHRIVTKRTKFDSQTKILNRNLKWEILPNRLKIQEVLYQFAFYRLCCFFKIGAKTITIFGFDLVCYQDLIQFYIQQCLGEIHDSVQYDIKLALRILHKLKIIHKDIKPANMFYSPAYKKFVLIDFGISQQVTSQIGEKTFTYKQGTPGYMSPEMSKIKTKKCQEIDLYYNDMYGLQITISQLKEKQKQYKKDEGLNQINPYAIKFYKGIALLYSIINYQQQKIQMMNNQYDSLLILSQIKSIIRHLDKEQIKKPFQMNPFSHKLNKQMIQKYFSTRSQKLFNLIEVQFLIRIYGISRILLSYAHQFKKNQYIHNLIQTIRQLQPEEGMDHKDYQNKKSYSYNKYYCFEQQQQEIVLVKSLQRQIIFLQENLVMTYNDHDAFEYLQIALNLMLKGKNICKIMFEETLQLFRQRCPWKQKIQLINCLLQIQMVEKPQIQIFQRYLVKRNFEINWRQRISIYQKLIILYNDLKDYQKSNYYQQLIITQLQNHQQITIQNAQITNTQSYIQQSRAIQKIFQFYKDKKQNKYALVCLQKSLQYLILFQHSTQYVLTLNNIGNLYKMDCNTNDIDHYQQYFQKALIQYNNQDQNLLLQILWNLARCKYLKMNPQKAHFYLQRSLLIALENFGPQHYKISLYYTSLAYLCFSNHDFQKSQYYCQKALKILSRLKLQESIKYVNALELLGYIYHHQRRIQQALEVFKECLKYKQKVYGQNDKQIVKTLNGIIISQKGENQLKYAQRAVKICQNMKLVSNILIQANSLLAIAYYHLNDFQKFYKITIRNIQIAKNHYGDNSKYIVYSYNSLGKYYWIQKQYNQSMEWYLKALNIKKKWLGQDHFDLVYDLTQIGECYFQIQDYVNTIKFLGKAVQIMNRFYDSTHQKYFEQSFNISQSYEKLKKYGHSLKILKQLLLICQQSGNILVRNNIEQIMLRLGNCYDNRCTYLDHVHSLYFYKKHVKLKKTMEKQTYIIILKIEELEIKLKKNNKIRNKFLNLNEYYQILKHEFFKFFILIQNYYLKNLEFDLSVFTLNRLFKIQTAPQIKTIYIQILKKLQKKNNLLYKIINKLQNQLSINFKSKHQFELISQLKRFLTFNRKLYYRFTYQQKLKKIIKNLIDNTGKTIQILK